MRSELQGIRVVHAATCANMLTAFDRVLARKLIEQGAELHLLASSLVIYGRAPDIEDLRSLGGTPHTVALPAGVHPWASFKATIAIYRLFREIKPDIVHTRGSVMGAVGRLAARLARVPHVVHHQDDLHARETRLSSPLRWLVARVESFLSRLSDKNFFVSGAVQSDAIRQGFRAGDSVMVGHDLSDWVAAELATDGPRAASPTALTRQHGFNPEHFVVGCISRLEAHKGIDVLIRAAAEVCSEFDEVRFFIRGNGPERNALQQLIRDLRLEERVVLVHDWLDQEGLADLMRSFDLFALPTRREGFGMVFAEAMAFGVVPVGPDIAPVNEVISPGAGLLVEPTVQGFVDAIRQCVSDRQRLAEMSSTARKFAQERWGGTAAADRVVAVYHELFAQNV